MPSEPTHAQHRGDPSVCFDTEPSVPGPLPHAAGARPVVTDGDGLSAVDRARLHRIHRLLLEARIASLERAVEGKERRLDAVIDHYELLLDEQRQPSAGMDQSTADAVDIELEDEEPPGLLERTRNALTGLF